MKKIDSHHHLIEEAGYVSMLLRTMDRLGIETSALIGLGPLFRHLFIRKPYDPAYKADNDAVEKVSHQHPDRFIPLGFIRLGTDGPETVTELYERGFQGIKFHIPLERYDSKEFFSVYQRVCDHKLPALFHTGVIGLPQPAPGEGISSFNMSCIHLEAVAQELPDMKIIIAHLGVQDYLTALTLIRIFPNIYADLSGSNPGWRANIPLDLWKQLLWFPDAHKKILFGSDVHEAEIGEGITIYENIITAAGWGVAERKSIYYDNAEKIFIPR
ncbi:MAG: amidohydrolase family protein [Kiritimatiellales bacterium]